MTTDEENAEWKLFHRMNGIDELDRRAARVQQEIEQRRREREREEEPRKK